MLRPIVMRRGRRGPRGVAPTKAVPLTLFAVNVVLLFTLGCSTALVGGGVTVAHAYTALTADLPNPTELTSQPLPQVTQLNDRTGQHLLYEFYDERRIEVPLSQIAPVMQQATLAIEDANFYLHQGYDPKGI